MDNKKPFTTGQNGRRKSGGSTQLRSPIIKRPSSAPVSLQGWLHKQGSEGLMLWKKRWFVLSEYCLFYYKGPEEEKLLGSILLPSYKVSPCTADDKVYRKFAFKAEHANMRTYYFAAETRELMTRWMNALSLATILQESGKLQNQLQPSVTIPSVIKENSDSSTCNSKEYRPCSVPITIQPTSQSRILEKNSDNVNGWMPQPLQNSYQPLYANAPPKPKRLNNEGQYGSSPEASPPRRDDAENIIYGNRKQYQQGVNLNRGQEPAYYSYKSRPDIVHSSPYSNDYLGKKTPPDFLQNIDVNSSYLSKKSPRKDYDAFNYSDFIKSNSNHMFPRANKQNFFGHDKKPYNQPVVNYQYTNYIQPQSYRTVPQGSSAGYQDYDNNKNFLSKRGSQPPRPHSADFLDYDAKNYYLNKEIKEAAVAQRPSSKIDQYTARPPRPKSSLDIMHTNDGYDWSEERYAERMRQSAIYLQNSLPQRSQSSRSNTPSFKQMSENKTLLEYRNTKSDDVPVSIKQRILREINKSPSAALNLKKWSEHQYETDNQFFRSASARLPKQRTLDEESDEVQAYTGGEDFSENRKEDSMKRLLEWKQRMLQSPLTRKPSGSSTRGTAQNELSKFYKQQFYKELERPEMGNRDDLGRKRVKPDGKRMASRSTDGRRSAMFSSDRFYNYSSDDEENEGSSDKRPRRGTQTGKLRSEEPKEKIISSHPEMVLNCISPDYENVSHTLNFNDRLSEEQNNEHIQSRENDEIHATKKPYFLKTDANKNESERTQNSETYMGSKNISQVLEKAEDMVTSSASEVLKSGAHNLDHDTKLKTSPPKKPNWNEKIDESKLIKEFSYQYIKETESPKTTSADYKVLDAPPENIVKSRIKQLGLDVSLEFDKEATLKEPLKVSSPVFPLNEAHVSSLKNVETDLQEKGKGVTKCTSDDIQQTPSKTCLKSFGEKQQKSVKDLLADFERKSQLFQEKEALEQERSFEEIPGKRYVFSDTETLLYDSSSDMEEKKEEPDPRVLSSLKQSEFRKEILEELTEEEEDGDEEVAAALGRRERFFSSCRDLSRKHDSTCGRHRLLGKQTVIEPSPSSEVETIMTPGFLRSSLTELVAALENSDSTCSTPTIDKVKGSLEKTLPKENLDESVDENLTESKEENCEGHYMPMTPSRRVSAPSSDKSRSNSSLHSFLMAVEETYVEMGENGFSTSHPETNKSSLSKIRKAYLDQNTGYCEITNEPESHYDFLYRSTSLREPEYMEVNTLLEILKEQDEKLKEHKDAVEDTSKRPSSKSNQERVPPTPPRSALPDILNSSSAAQQIAKSDSSDADDESSKDLDSLDIPRHPRFSLSDTFRPASYYLGSIINERKRSLIRLPNPSENHDSSDSDLVSPPPIPTSPPLIDELDTSLETEKSLEIRPNVSKIKVDKDASKKIWSKGSSDLEYDADLQKNKKLSGLDTTLGSLESNQSVDQVVNEKPVVFCELDAIGSRNGLALDDENSDINLDKYLEELQLNGNLNAHLYSKNFGESIYKSCQKEIHKNLMPKDSINKADSNEKTLLKIKNLQESLNNTEVESLEVAKSGEEVQYENLQAFFPPPPPELYDSGNDHSDRESNVAFYSNASFPEVPPPDNYCDVYDPDIPGNSKGYFQPGSVQQGSVPDNVVTKPTAFENQGAPYYYSDIIKNDEEDFGGLTSDRSLAGVKGYFGNFRNQTLNNQRGDVQETNQGVKRNDIGRKVNPISENYVADNPLNGLDEVQKIAAELRTTSAHFIGAADKTGTVDVRNIYESDTLQRRKTGISEEVRARTPDMRHSQGVARNLYPHGLKDKSVGNNLLNKTPGYCPEFSSLQSQARSRSLEGLLNDVGYTSETGTRCRLPNQTSTPPNFPNSSTTLNEPKAQKVQSKHLRIHSCEGDEPWEKDAIWRENLRKASLRHTRSLDNLDEDSSNTRRRLNLSNSSAASDTNASESQNVSNPSNLTGRRSADHLSGPTKPKFKREVTYVNDVFRKNRQLDLAREYEHDYREGRIKPKKKEGEIQTVVELSDSGVLDCDDGIHYEKLTRTRVSGQRPVQNKNSPEGVEKRGTRNTESTVTSPTQKPSEDSLHTSQLPLNSNQSSALKPIDREKLRQWDLMSSGMVEQDVVKKKITPSDHQSTVDKTVTTDSKAPNAYANEYFSSEEQTGETKSRLQNLAHNLEASGSGSAIREPDFSNITPVSPLQSRKIPLESTLVHSLTGKEKSLLDRSRETSGDRTMDGFTERIDYYDRGKDYLSSSVGFNDWNVACPEKRSDTGNITNDYPEKGRYMSENEYYTNQYLDKKDNTEYNRNCGTLPTLPTAKNEVQLTSVQNLSLGRNSGISDGRYPSMESSVKRKVSSNPWGLDVSAGELLGRTHEELVLLLIQLRRQSASICKAMEACHIEIEEQARMAAVDSPSRMEHIRKLEKLKKHLLELEKQYEKGKPLVNLVDNMVKLGSLYKGNNNFYNSSLGLEYNPDVREKLEFNQKVQEQRLLAEERRDWDRLSPDHGQLQAKVQQLYKLDKLLQEESGTLHSLQQDKELLEKALGGLRHKLQVNRSNPIEADRCRKQQKLLEKELSRVRLLLAHNSKKLEETVAENARLEQELVILRQKLQASRVSSRSPVPLLESTTWSTTAALEAELRRVQQLVGDLQRQRHELSAQVKQLTEKSDNLVQQIRPGPTGVAGAGPIPGKKKSNSTWLETDLDLLVTQNLGVENIPTSPQHQPMAVSPGSESSTPIYINTETSKKDTASPSEELKSSSKVSLPEENSTKTYCIPVELSEADERMKRFYGIIPKEKQEIKTVRIVKRESERRQRDRDRSGNIGIPIGSTAVAKRVSVIEESDGYGLERVDEESFENNRYSPNFSELGGDYQEQEYSTQEPQQDAFLNFHPTNPFLPQNLQRNVEVSSDNQDLMSLPGGRSMSLPRGFARSNVPSQTMKNEETSESKVSGSRRNRVRFENNYQNGSESESGLSSPRNENSIGNYCYPREAEYSLSRVHLKNFNLPQKLYGPSESMSSTQVGKSSKLGSDTRNLEFLKDRSDLTRPLTAKEQLFSSNYCSQGENSPQLSPVYQSEAAREIVMEMSNNSTQNDSHRRRIRKEKRRHHTVSNIRHVPEGNDNFRMGSARSRDDLDMERALRPRINTPDVVRSTMSQKDLKYNESTIDSILGTPSKIVIPERYVPEQEQLTAEEQLQRLRKAESIRKMLSETTALSSPDLSGEGIEEEKKSCTLKKKVEEEKKQREHLLELNQILAQQVMEKSKLVAVKALAALPLEKEGSFEDEDSSPVQTLPLYQQRENYFS